MEEFVPLEKKKRFIGGAERARRNAKKRRWQQQTNVGARSHKSHVPNRLPKSVPPSERFYASLLMSSANELMASNKNNHDWIRIMGQICQRAGLSLPQKLPCSNNDRTEFYNLRGSLVLEESRCLLSDGVRESKKKRQLSCGKDVGDGVPVELLNIQDRRNENGYMLSFRKLNLQEWQQSDVSFNTKEMQNMRHGTVFEIVPFNNRMGHRRHVDKTNPMNCNDSRESSVLAAIMPWMSSNESGAGGKVSLIVYRVKGLQQMMRSSSRWILYPIVALISEQRQFVACCDAKKVPFLPKLLGMKSASHIRFGDCDLEKSDVITICDSEDEGDETHTTNADIEMTDKKEVIVVDSSSDSENPLFSDDSSSDGTIETAKDLRKDDSNNGQNNTDFSSEQHHIYLAEGESSKKEDGCILKDSDNLMSEKSVLPHKEKDDKEAAVSKNNQIRGENEKSYAMANKKEPQSEIKGGHEILEVAHGSVTDNGLDSCEREVTPLNECLSSTTCSNHLSTEKLQLPILNETQEEAAVSFLNSPSSTLSLVQGPPGTGKTTFLATVILRSFLEDSSSNHCGSGFKIERRALVSAPTNRAINVLASKILDILKGDTHLNLVLIGVEDKLDLEEINQSLDETLGKSSNSIRSIFAYTWLDDMIEKIASVHKDLQRPSSYQEKKHVILKRVRQFVAELKNQLPYWAGKCGALNCIKDFFKYLEDDSENSLADRLDDARRSIAHATQALKSINKMDSVDELLRNANIIFSTLTSSACSPMRKTSQIDDLFVDEAGAATEPQIMIPFRLEPSRMLAVGDPQQLPATLTSQRAISYGLDKSLLDRMMYSCGAEHIMLNVQYRMKPEISSFPSLKFYNGKIMDGPNVKNSTYKTNAAIFNNKAYVFLDVRGQECQAAGGSYYNEIEARTIAEVIKSIRRKTKFEKHSTPWDSSEKIRIITFYQAQVHCLRRYLRQSGIDNVLVATVDSSQGCEADIIVLSFVRSNQRAGFLQDDRRMNVALTRAKYQLICVGDVKRTLSVTGINTIDDMIDNAKQRRVVMDFDTCKDPSSALLKTSR